MLAAIFRHSIGYTTDTIRKLSPNERTGRYPAPRMSSYEPFLAFDIFPLEAVTEVQPTAQIISAPMSIDLIGNHLIGCQGFVSMYVHNPVLHLL